MTSKLFSSPEQLDSWDRLCSGDYLRSQHLNVFTCSVGAAKSKCSVLKSTDTNRTPPNTQASQNKMVRALFTSYSGGFDQQ